MQTRLILKNYQLYNDTLVLKKFQLNLCYKYGFQPKIEYFFVVIATVDFGKIIVKGIAKIWL